MGVRGGGGHGELRPLMIILVIPGKCLAAKEMFAVLSRERGWESGQPDSRQGQKSN